MVKKVCFFSTNFAVHKQVRVQYAEKYLPKEMDLFYATYPSQNHYNFRRAKIIEISEGEVKFTLGLRKFCKENKIDLLVNLGSTRESIGMLFATIGLDTKYIVQIMGNPWDSPKLQKGVLKKTAMILENLFYSVSFSLAEKIIFGAEDIQEKARRFFPFIKDKILHCDLILDERLFSPKNKQSIRKKLNLPLKKEIVIFVGRIDYLKGSDIMFELIKNNPERLFVLVGKISDERFKENILKNAVILESLDVASLADYYCASDLSILPSRIEGYGLVSRESMLCETPALVSDIPCLRKIKNVLIADLSVGAMQKKIDEFFSMPEKERNLLGKKGRKFVIKDCSYKILKPKFLKIYLNKN